MHKRHTVTLRIIVAVSVCLALFFSAFAGEGWAQGTTGKKWTFVVFGDTRDDTKATDRGISAVLPQLARFIANERPDLVVFNGDMVNGYWTNKKSFLHGNYKAMFLNWLKATTPIREAAIPLYIVRGNHEFGGEVRSGGVPDLIRTFNEIFASTMPQNGPDDAKGLTYSFPYRSAFFVVTDQYVGSTGTDVTINLPWITRQLKENTRPFVFVFGHSPAFHVTQSSDESEFQLFNVPAVRDQFWRLMVQNRVVAYIASHEHFYTRGKRDSVYQIVQGNGGATPFTYKPKEVDRSLTTVFPTKKIHKRDIMPGFLVVTVDEESQTVTATEKCITDDGSLIVFDTFVMR